MTMRYAVLGVLGVGLALASGACGSPAAAPSTAPSATPSVAASATTSAAAPATSPAVSSGTPPAASSGTGGAVVRVCRNEDVAVTVTMQEASGTTRRGLVSVENRTKQACRVEGRAAISLSNAANETVPVPTKDVNQPGRAVPITLPPGTNAFEGIKWQTCDKGSSSCPAGNGLRFNLQASTDGPAATLEGFPPGLDSDITMASLQVGTLQPSTQGVVAW
ncbi:DUF4232 domain-containing protein [Actinoplanes solisilvae]|uniref:DUF4232 domain-containing protein n=1 Tax=Actinoplanes solisilvae TaxID=2486853 RepID=UPI0013E2E852|nr:DUF4232 domain-containing protein [Actinoplanes solisilvae]